MDAAERIFNALKNDFGFEGAEGKITFNLKDFRIIVEQNNIVGNILEEWLAKWMVDKGIAHIHNHKQESPDFWLNPEKLDEDWLEIKSFTGSPNFDIAAFRSFIELIIAKPYKLHSKYLLIKYKMQNGIVTIENIWLKSVWEISCTSERFPIKVQYKNKTIVNIRPAVWYSENTDYFVFECLEDFLAALEQTIYKYHDTNNIAENWADRLSKSYKKFYGIDLDIPRWNDVKSKYIK
uniref:NgoBV family restriction endonuclease n=1 Tax=Prevotella sp. GTC17254 TaxID=3236794 RepID=A0AB33IXK6_9BACT